MNIIEIQENRAETELEILDNEVMDLEVLAKKSLPFVCKDIQ